jgi:rRNA maturation endonuclease Nob1
VTAVVAAILILAVAAYVTLPLFAQEERAESGAPAHGELWAHEKAVAVLAITEADFDRATGKLSEDDYMVLRSDYEGRALQAMDAMERNPPSQSEGPARYCAGCGSPFTETDAYCGSCGRRRFVA